MAGVVPVIGAAVVQAAVTTFEAYQLARSSYDAYQDGQAAHQFVRQHVADWINTPPKKRLRGNVEAFGTTPFQQINGRRYHSDSQQWQASTNGPFIARELKRRKKRFRR